MNWFAFAVETVVGTLFGSIILFWVIRFAINESNLCEYARQIVELLKQQNEMKVKKD